QRVDRFACLDQPPGARRAERTGQMSNGVGERERAWARLEGQSFGPRAAFERVPGWNGCEGEICRLRWCGTSDSRGIVAARHLGQSVEQTSRRGVLRSLQIRVHLIIGGMQ